MARDFLKNSKRHYSNSMYLGTNISKHNHYSVNIWSSRFHPQYFFRLWITKTPKLFLLLLSISCLFSSSYVKKTFFTNQYDDIFFPFWKGINNSSLSFLSYLIDPLHYTIQKDLCLLLLSKVGLFWILNFFMPNEFHLVLQISHIR